MKRFFPLFFLLVLTTSSFAQDEPQKEDTNFTPVKSGRDDGFLIRPQLSFSTLSENYSNSFMAEAQCTFAYQLGPRMSIGCGTGFLGSSVVVWGKPDHILFSIPIFLDVRYYILDRLWSPYLELRGGFNLKLNESYYDLKSEFQNCTYYDVFQYFKGSMMDFSVGVQYKNIDCGLSLKNVTMVHYEDYYYTDHYEIDGVGYDNIYDSDRYYRDPIWFFAINFAYNFPLKGK